MAKQTKTTASKQQANPSIAETETALASGELEQQPTIEAAPELESTAEPSQAVERKYIAIAKVFATLVAEDGQLFIVTNEDSARFAVCGVLKGKLSMKLIATPADERKGVFGLWPRPDGSVIVGSFGKLENNSPAVFGPCIDEMMLSGYIEACESNEFTVRVKRNKERGRGSRKFKGMTLTVPSAPAADLEPGMWVDLTLKRVGTQWVLPES
jgi:hypothetical protein